MKSDFLAKISLTGSFMGIYRVLWFRSFAVWFCSVCLELHLPLTGQFRAIMALFSPWRVLALNVWFVNILSAQMFASPEGLSVLTPFLQFPRDLTPVGGLCVCMYICIWPVCKLTLPQLWGLNSPLPCIVSVMLIWAAVHVQLAQENAASHLYHWCLKKTKLFL